MIDQTLGQYTLTKELGKGGFATVYKALQANLNRDVAIKVLHPEFIREERALKRFKREALAVARLSHPNIVGVYDYGEHDGRAYLVMEYIAGNTLKARLGKPVSAEFALDMMRSVGSALDYAHSKGIIHRDIKPANILFTEDDRIVLSDFGIVRLADDDQSLTRGVIGTPQYMSPEQALGREVDGRSDLYSLGVVLYEMLAGRVPYKGDSAIATLSMHATLPVPSVRDMNPDVPVVIDEVVQKALAKDPEDRFQTGAELASALAAAISSPDQTVAPTMLVSTLGGDTSLSQATTSPTPPPVDLDALYQQLLGLTRVRDWRSAVALAAQILARDPNYRDVSAILASASNELRYGRGSTSVALEFQNMMAEVDTAIRGGRLMEAAAMLQQLLRTSPNEPSARMKLEQVNRMMQDVETQRRRLSRLDQLYALAESKMGGDDLRWALHIFEEIAAMDRNYRDVTEKIAEIKSQIDPAIQVVAPATQVTSLRDVAEAAMQQERWTDAVAAFEEIQKLQPNLGGISERLEVARHQAKVTSLNAEAARLVAQGNLAAAIEKLDGMERLTKHAPATGGAVGASGSPEFPGLTVDRVSFSVTTPMQVEPGAAFVLDVWAHLDSQRPTVIERARESLRDDAIRVQTKGPVRIARGAVVTVLLKVRGLLVSEPEDTILWEGEVGNASFLVRVPPEAPTGPCPGHVLIYLDGLQIARLPFAVEVGHDLAEVRVSSKTQRYRTAFASYASEDLDEVIGRIQGIQKAAPDLDVFFDRASLRSGQRWEHEIYARIPSSDVFYLFWSSHARDSHWVEREWRYALDVRGLDFIEPVPLVSPDVVPPPSALAAKHFNDWILAYRRVGAVPGR